MYYRQLMLKSFTKKYYSYIYTQGRDRQRKRKNQGGKEEEREGRKEEAKVVKGEAKVVRFSQIGALGAG